LPKCNQELYFCYPFLSKSCHWKPSSLLDVLADLRQKSISKAIIFYLFTFSHFYLIRQT
jgi:hypothetical protein